MKNRMNQKLRQQLVIRDTGKYGKGVFAKSDFSKGEVIYTLEGERLDVVQVVDRVVAGDEYIDDIFQIGRRTYLDLDEFSRTFNHSCDPTAGLRKNSELFAMRDIRRGEQITYDYSTTISPTDWSMKCKCGSAKCRHVIHDILSIPKSQVRLYKEEGALQRYMKGVLHEYETGTYVMPAYEKRALERLAEMP